MALDVATGTFAIGTTTGTLEVNISPAFQPKVVVCWWSRATADATFSASPGFGFGVAVDRATDQSFNVTCFNADNVGTTDSARAKSVSDLIRNIANGAAGNNVIASISSFDADGFTINRTTNDGTNNNIIHYLCLGGAEITDAFLKECEITTGIGSKPITGIGFQGNLALFFGALLSASGTTSAVRIENFIGASNGTQHHAVNWYSQDGTTAANAAKSYIDSGACVLLHDYGIGAGPSIRGSLSSFDSDGFTLNIGTMNEASSRYVFALVLKGNFQSHIGQTARETSTTTQQITSPGFQPKGVMLLGGFATANATETTESHLCIGAGTASGANGLWIGDAATINTDTNQYSSASNIYTQATNPSTVVAQASLSSLLTTGYELTWGVADANARLFMHIALGNTSSSPPMFRGS
jgi:hypothetical protein